MLCFKQNKKKDPNSGTAVQNMEKGSGKSPLTEEWSGQEGWAQGTGLGPIVDCGDPGRGVVARVAGDFLKSYIFLPTP